MSIAEYYDQSELALAAYAVFPSGIEGDAYIGALQEAGIKMGSDTIIFPAMAHGLWWGNGP